MTQGDEAPAAWAALVPELNVRDLARSLDFWVGLCGFRVAYGRPEATREEIRFGDSVEVRLRETLLQSVLGLGVTCCTVTSLVLLPALLAMLGVSAAGDEQAGEAGEAGDMEAVQAA